ncbi:MAG: type II secretion system F family protein [candidate division Zixibacteria bacterium]
MITRYKYVAISPEGRKSKGIIEADSDQAAKSIVDSRGLLPVSVRKLSGGTKSLRLLFRSSVKPENLIIFTRKLLTLNRAGIPLLRSLGIIAADMDDTKLSNVIQNVRKSVEGGASFSQALDNHAGYFPGLFISTIKAGEESGTMDIMLMRALELIEREERIKQRVKEAVRYPSFVVFTMGLAFIVVITFVIPKFAAMYSGYGADLPWATRLLIAVNHIISNYWPFMIIVLPALVTVLWRMRLTRWGKRGFDYAKLSIPLMGAVVAKTILSRFCYILSTLLAAGLPLSQALGILRTSVNNYYFSKVIEKMTENLSGGRDLVQPMRDSKYFGSMVVQMFSIGLESGSLEDLLSETARHYDAEIEHDTKKLTSRIEPILTVLIATAVLILALAIFMPMWNLIGIFRR